MPDSGLSGQYGTIPYSILREKNEITPMYESPYDIYDYQRSTLRDQSCDATFFESDHKREDNHSEEFLSLRYTGHRSGETPNAPDLFLELTGRDPRSTSNDPNMRLAAEQTWARKEAFKFYKDDDLSIVEREKRPQVLIAQMRDSFYAVKNRLKIFNTSKDHLVGSGANYRHTASTKVHADDVQNGITLRDELISGNSTVKLSNNAQLGWEQTSDHEFKVAQYGQSRAIKVSSDVQTNRANTNGESDITVFRDQVVTNGVANIMKNVIEGRIKREQQGDQDLTKSVESVNTQYKLHSKKTNEVETDTDLKDSQKTVERFLGQLKRQTGMSNQDVQANLISDSMSTAIRKIKKGESAFKSSDIVMSNAKREDFSEIKRTKNFKHDLTKRNTSETAKRLDSMQIARLGSAKLTNMGGTVLIKDQHGSQTYKSSDETKLMKNKNPELRNPYTAQNAQKMETFGIVDRTTKGLGSKFTRSYIDRDSNSNDIASMS